MQANVTTGTLTTRDPSARAKLKAASEDLFARVMRANGMRLLSKEELQQFRLLNKRLGRATDSRFVADRSANLLEEARRFASLVDRRLAEEPIAAQKQKEVSGPLGEAASVQESCMDTIPGGSPGHETPHQPPRADVLKEAAKQNRATSGEDAARALRISRLIMGGATAAEALRQVGLEVTRTNKRWAQRLGSRGKDPEAPLDRRRSNCGRPVSASKAETRRMITAIGMAHPRAKAPQLLAAFTMNVNEATAKSCAGEAIPNPLLQRIVQDAEFRLPSESTVRRIIGENALLVRSLRASGTEETRRQHRPIDDQDRTSASNEVWEIDHTPLDCYVKVEENGQLVARRPSLTIAIDAHSRAIMSFVLSLRHPDAFTSAIAIRQAVRPAEDASTNAPCGLPLNIIMDRGADFRSMQVRSLLARLNVDAKYAYPSCGDAKPYVERVFLTIKDSFLPLVPGFMYGSDRGTPMKSARVATFLTVSELRALLDDWVTRIYRQRKHSTTGEAPAKRFNRTCLPMRSFEESELNLLILQADERSVRRAEVTLPTAAGLLRYTSSDLYEHEGRKLEVRWNPDSLEHVYAYTLDGDYVGRLTNCAHVDMKEHLLGFNRWLKERKSEIQKDADALKRYHEFILAEDRPSRKELRAKYSPRKGESVVCASEANGGREHTSTGEATTDGEVLDADEELALLRKRLAS